MVGDLVEANYRTREGWVTEEWYTATLVGQNADGTFQVEFLFGRYWWDAPPQHIRAYEGFRPGDIIEAQYMTRAGSITASWYRGTITGVNMHGTYRVTFSDGSYWWDVPQAHLRQGPIRLVQGGAFDCAKDQPEDVRILVVRTIGGDLVLSYEVQESDATVSELKRMLAGRGLPRSRCLRLVHQESELRNGQILFQVLSPRPITEVVLVRLPESGPCGSCRLDVVCRGCRLPVNVSLSRQSPVCQGCQERRCASPISCCLDFYYRKGNRTGSGLYSALFTEGTLSDGDDDQ